MTSHRLTSQELRHLDKLLKFLTIKYVQVVVQSRLGEKLKTKSKPHSSGADWFNLPIHDVEEIVTETKKALGDNNTSLSQGLSLSVEISLKRPEGDGMVLETWWLCLSEPADHALKVTCPVMYSRMGLLLKSLICVSRTTPAYKLSFRQSAESFVLCYQIYQGHPEVHALGENSAQYTIGQVATPCGTIYLSVAFRTNLTMSPSSHSEDISIIVKSDHFDYDTQQNKNKLADGHIVCKAGGKCAEVETTECKNNDVINPPFLSDNESENSTNSNGVSEIKSDDSGAKIGAFVSTIPEEEEEETTDAIFIPETPFSNLLNTKTIANIDIEQVNVAKINTDIEGLVTNMKSMFKVTGHCTTTSENVKLAGTVEKHSETMIASGGSITSADDFVVIDLKPPFVGGEVENDLGNFFRECNSAPALASLNSDVVITQNVEISRQLKAFEMSLHEFDQFVGELCSIEESK